MGCPEAGSGCICWAWAVGRGGERAAQAAGELLVTLGRSVAATAIGYLGSNTAVAKAIGLGALRLGLGALTRLQTKAAPGKRFAWAVIMHVSD